MAKGNRASRQLMSIIDGLALVSAIGRPSVTQKVGDFADSFLNSGSSSWIPLSAHPRHI